MTDLDALTTAERTRETDALYERREREKARGHPHCIEFGCEMRMPWILHPRWRECWYCKVQMVVP